MNFWRRALTLIWSRSLRMQVVIRGMAHRPSVVRSIFCCLVSWALRHQMASLYPDFTQTKPGWGCRFSGPLYFVIPDQNRGLLMVQVAA